jgi:hypothetical protein
VLAPATAQKITPTTDVVPLTVQGAAGGVADLLLINGQSGSNVAKFDRFGNVITPAIIVGGTGGVSTVRVTAKGVASQSGDLQQWTNSANAVLAKVDAAGILSTPAVTTATTELKLEQTGDALGSSRMYLRNRTGINGALFENPAIDLADFSLKGSTAAQSTIRHENRGVQRLYNAPELQFGTAGDPRLIVANNLGVLCRAAAAATVPLVVRGFTSQSSNLQEWQSDTSSVLARLQAAGDFWSNGGLYCGTTFPSGTAQGAFGASIATKIGLIVRGFASQSANLQQWQNDAGGVLMAVDAFGNLMVNLLKTTGNLTRMALNANASAQGNVLFDATGAGNIPLVARGAASQTADLQQWNDSANVVLAQITPGAWLGIANTPAVPASNRATGGYLYAEAGALKWRGSAGTVTTIAPA